MTPTSIPTPRPQPNLPTYNFDALSLVPLFTRASFIGAFGVQPPDFDASRPAQYWFDSSADPNEPYSYTSVDAEGNFTTRLIPGAQAVMVNIPGLFVYPTYEVAPTAAFIGNQNGDQLATIDPHSLASYQDAVTLALSMGLTAAAILDMSFQSGPFRIYYGAETRRQYGIIWKAGNPPALAGYLLQQMYSPRGIGAPGSWNLNGDSPVWNPAPVPPDGITAGVPLSATPPPVRPLQQNEILIRTMFGAEIGRTDLLPAAIVNSQQAA